jgi:hypothetical protein
VFRYWETGIPVAIPEGWFSSHLSFGQFDTCMSNPDVQDLSSFPLGRPGRRRKFNEAGSGPQEEVAGGKGHIKAQVYLSNMFFVTIFL